MSARILERGDAAYPDLLASIHGAPRVLHVLGADPPERAVAVVGSRRPTPYGRRMARLLGRECAEAGVALVSGLARGVDSEAHSACAEAGGRTWAVLGSGLDRVYPSENAGLAREIVAAGGGLLSEYPPGTAPLAGHFPRRNRIISGLCFAVVVVEGDLRSGSLITAKEALEQGREVFAVPGPADAALSAGPNELLFNGAGLARCLADVLFACPPLAAPEQGAAAAGSPEERKILELLGAHELGVDELLSETGWEPARLFQHLSVLESRDRIRRIPGQRYARAQGL
ncbi:MAG TPA: DNA-processing protein DprA [Elusimicrobiota bacterium]|nr:DNA-processing protein DprA [Elusimicrobiota bacterium]